jgi:hypothetical protein
LLAHHATISTAQPLLPQSAAKAFTRPHLFSDRLSCYQDKISPTGYKKPKRRKGALTQLIILSEVHREIDVANLIDALKDYRGSQR